MDPELPEKNGPGSNPVKTNTLTYDFHALCKQGRNVHKRRMCTEIQPFIKTESRDNKETVFT